MLYCQNTYYIFFISNHNHYSVFLSTLLTSLFKPKRLEIIIIRFPMLLLPHSLIGLLFHSAIFSSFLSYYVFFICLSLLLFPPLHHGSLDLIKILFHFLPHLSLYQTNYFSGFSFSLFLSLLSLSPAEGV